MSATVGVVDGDPQARGSLVELLESRGHTVVGFGRVGNALVQLSQRPPGLLVTEVELPDGSGLELIARLRSVDPDGQLKVLVVSGGDSESSVLRAYAAGADDFLSKPFSAGELLAKCAVLLKRSHASRRPPPPLLAPDRLLVGRYRPLGSLGEGGFAAVYRAEDTASGNVVALKLLSRSRSLSEEEQHRFLREAHVLSSVDHPHVVRVLDFGNYQGQLYCAMEYIAGSNLSDYCLQRGQLSEAELLRFLVPLVAAVAALHERSLVHRDLKPGNVMLRKGDISDPVLIDFGLTKLVFDRGLTDPGVVLGTPGYLAPEVYYGAELDELTDLYSLGMVARFAVAGEFCPGLDGFEIIKRIVKGDVPVPKLRSRALRRVIAQLLQVDAKRRPRTAAEVGARLVAIARSLLSDATPQPTSETRRQTLQVEKEHPDARNEP